MWNVECGNLKMSGLDSIRSFSCSLPHIAAPVTTLNVALRAVVHAVLEVEGFVVQTFQELRRIIEVQAYLALAHLWPNDAVLIKPHAATRLYYIVVDQWGHDVTEPHNIRTRQPCRTPFFDPLRELPLARYGTFAYF